MKKICILTIILLLGFSVFSQNKDVHIIELLPNDTEQIINSDFYISEVIDNRILKSNIGIAQKGLMNRKVLSDFKKDFQTEILDYLETILPKDSTKIPLTLRINQLLISEQTGAFKETGKAIVRLNVLRKLDKSSYANLGNFDATRSKNSMDVTRKHDDRIRGVLRDCLIKFDSLDWKILEPKPFNPNTNEVVTILKEQPKMGFYETYNEFVNNNLVNITSFKKQKRSTPEKLHLKDTVTKKKIVDFAYYDGIDFFINASVYSGQRHYIKTEVLDDFLIFTDVFVNQDNVTGMSMAFGVLGVLASNERQIVLFNINNGMFNPMNRTKMKLLLKKDYPNLYKTYKRNYRNIKIVKELILELRKKLSKEDFNALITN